MTCRAIRPYIRPYVKGELAVAERRRVADHLQGCPRCAAARRQHGAALAALEMLPASEPGPAVRAALWTPAAGRTSRRRLLHRAADGAALAGAGILGAVVLARIGQAAGERRAGSALPRTSTAESASSLPTAGQYRFGDAVLLEAWTLPQELDAGQALDVRLRWRFLQVPPPHLAVFVHLTASDGRVVAQLDRALAGAAGPIAPAGAGDSAEGVLQVAVPGGLPPGMYAVQLGLYDLASGQRLAATPVTGRQQPNDSIDLGSVRVS